MALRDEQRRVIKGALAALIFSALVLVGGYFYIPFHKSFAGMGERLAFTVKADIFVLIWLLIAVGRVGNGRFFSSVDIQGSGFAGPSPKISIPAAILQNTLEQTVLTVGLHLCLATLLSDREMVLIPLSVVLFGIGRIAFMAGYSKGAGGRAFGFGTTAYPTMIGYVLAICLLFMRG